MALTFSYPELRKLRLAVEKHINFVEGAIRRNKSMLDGNWKLPNGKRVNRGSVLESTADMEEKLDAYHTILQKISEEMRKLEGTEARTAGIRPVSK